MNNLPPGVLYLFQRAPKLLSPPALTYGIIRFIDVNCDTYISTWWLMVLMVMSLPLALTLSVLLDEVSILIEASKRGAVLPIRVWVPYPGSVVTVVALVSNHKKLRKGYPSDGFEELCEKLGSYTFNRRILFENWVCRLEHL